MSCFIEPHRSSAFVKHNTRSNNSASVNSLYTDCLTCRKLFPLYVITPTSGAPLS